VTVGYGNVVPTNTLEYIFVNIFMLVAVMIYSYIMGILTFQFSKLNEKQMILKEKEVYFNEIAGQYKLSYSIHENLLKTVENSVISNSNKLLETFKTDFVINELPPNLQAEVCLIIFKDVIKNFDFFKNQPQDFINKIFKLFHPIFLSEGEEIYHQGQAASEIYFLINGRIISKYQKGSFTKALINVEGSYFGEVDIIF
jgi:hypothetical protein